MCFAAGAAMTDERYDAIIIGAGPAGSSAAIALARQGWRVAIVEKSAFPRRKVCGEFMSATNLALLDRLGVGDAWRAAAGPEIRRVGFFGGDDRRAPMPQAREGRLRPRAGARPARHAAARSGATAGAEMFQPWRAIDIARRAASCTPSRSRTGRRGNDAARAGGHRRAWLLGAGRLPSQLDKTTTPSDLLGFKAHFTGASLPPDLMPLLDLSRRLWRHGLGRSGRLSLSCCIRRDRLAAMRAEQATLPAPRRVHRHILDTCRGDTRGDRRCAASTAPWLAAGPIRPGIRSRYAEDIFRVGNIAGESHPIIAEGISMAMQSGWLLAEQLSAESMTAGRPRALAAERYAAEWRRLFATRIHAASAFAQIAMQPASARVMTAVIRLFRQR